MLFLKVTENGKLHDATLHVSEAGSTASVASGRSYTLDGSNPKKFVLAVGRYDAAIKSLDVAVDNTFKFEGIEVGKGQTVELTHDYKTAILSASTHSGAGATVD